MVADDRSATTEADRPSRSRGNRTRSEPEAAGDVDADGGGPRRRATPRQPTRPIDAGARASATSLPSARDTAEPDVLDAERRCRPTVPVASRARPARTPSPSPSAVTPSPPAEPVPEPEPAQSPSPAEPEPIVRPSPSPGRDEPRSAAPSAGSSPMRCARPASGWPSPSPARASSASSKASTAAGSASSRPVTRAAPRSWPRRMASSPGGPPRARDARRRGRQPRDRHPHRAPGLDADVRHRRPGRARGSAAARRSRRSTRPRRSAASPSAVELDRRRRTSAAMVGRRGAGRPSIGRPGPVFLSIPEDLLDEDAPAGTAARPLARRRPPGRERRRRPGRAPPAGRGRAPGHPGRRGRAARARPRPTSSGSPSCLRVPVIAGWRRGGRHPQRPPALPRHDRLRAARPTVRERLERPTRSLVLGCRLDEITRTATRSRRDGQRWMHVDIEPRGRAPRALPPPADRGPRPMPARSFGPRSPGSRTGVLDAAASDAPRRPQSARIGRRWEAPRSSTTTPWDGPGRPPRAGRRDAPADPPRRRDHHHRCRQLRAGSPAASASGGPGTFLGPTSGAMGYAPAGGDRRRPGPSRPRRRRPRRRRRLRDDDGRAGDGRPRAARVDRARLRQRALRHDPDAPGAPRRRTRTGDRDGPRADRLRGGRARLRRAGVRVETDAAFEPALRQALAKDRPTVIQLALDRGWVSPNARAPAVPEAELRPTYHLRRASGGRRRTRTRRSARPRWSRRASSIAPMAPCDGRDREPALRAGSAGVRGPDRRSRRDHEPVDRG